jgi:hypothetical protein
VSGPATRSNGHFPLSRSVTAHENMVITPDRFQLCGVSEKDAIEHLVDKLNSRIKNFLHDDPSVNSQIVTLL